MVISTFSHLNLPLLHCPLISQHDLHAHASDNLEEFDAVFLTYSYASVHFTAQHLCFIMMSASLIHWKFQKWITENIKVELQPCTLSAQVWSKQKKQCSVLPATEVNPDLEVRSSRTVQVRTAYPSTRPDFYIRIHHWPADLKELTCHKTFIIY
jgi:hypothetical protein